MNVIENGIDRLRFFLGNGREIQMKKQYSASFEIIPADMISQAFYKNPEGHFELRRPLDISSEVVNVSVDWKQSPFYEPFPGMLYVLKVSGAENADVLKTYGGFNDSTTIQKVTVVTDDEVEIRLIVTGENTVTILSGDGYVVRTEDSEIKEVSRFRFFVPSSSEFRLTRQYMTAVVSIDNPGTIAPNVTFSRNQGTTDFVRSYEKIFSNEAGVVTDDTDPWKAIDGSSLSYTVDNVFDIIFFAYRTIDDDGNEHIVSNQLRLTLNDNDETVTEDYELYSFLQGSIQTCLDQNLTIQKTLESSDDGFFAETADEIISHEISTEDSVYGVCPGLFAQSKMQNYLQYPDDMLDETAGLIRKVHADENRYYDDNILSMVVSIMEKYDFDNDYWNSSKVVSLVRDLDDEGQPQQWDSDERSYELAEVLLDMLIYSDEPDIVRIQTVAYYTVNYNIPESQFPYVRYVGSVLQDKISGGFVLPETVVIVEENDEHRFVYPEISDDQTQYRIHFRFGSDSEMFFIQMKDSMDMMRQNSLFALLPDEINRIPNDVRTNTLNFTVGFQAEREGCYQNVMGIFVRDNTTNEDFLAGAIEFKTTVEGEDERYRTLAENLGIPDPKIYPNIFREQDPDEQGIDWRLINRKSKELMLSFDQIFPYSGTYKALFKAIKFLGYQDVVFKEWYKIIDSNDQQKYVSVQNFDSSTGKTLRNTLKSYGVGFTDYQRYSKLNRLAMVYHMQELADGQTEEQLPVYGYVFNIRKNTNKIRVCYPGIDKPYRLLDLAETPDAFYDDRGKLLDENWDNEFSLHYEVSYASTVLKAPNGKYVSKDATPYRYSETNTPRNAVSATYMPYSPKQMYSLDSDGHRISWNKLTDEIPFVENIYEFRNEELLAKLYQVKLWLERYITGVGCYISDISGENIILERVKNQAHVTTSYVKDITQAGKFTPRTQIKTHIETDSDGNEKVVNDKFTDSSICLTCSLNEFRSLSFEDYADFPIERFVKWCYDASGNQVPLKTRVRMNSSFVEEDVYVSAPLNALTVADEMQYTLNLYGPDSGSLYEFADASCKDNPIMVADGEITLFSPDRKTSTITNCYDAVSRESLDPNASNECPVIEILKGNIREIYGDWSPESKDNNIAWSVMYSYGDDDNKYVRLSSQSDDYLYETTNPEIRKRCRIFDDDEVYPTYRFKGAVQFVPSNNARLEYTSVNKWNLPMFIMSGYYPGNQMPGDWKEDPNFRAALPDNFDRNRKYVVEILEGSIRFRNHKGDVPECECTAAEIVFEEASTDGIGEQEIRINYRYDSERKPIYEANPNDIKSAIEAKRFKSYNELYETLDGLVTVTGDVDVPVNRLGTYEVQVKAYDAYNNTFFNKSDDTVTVRAEMPSIDIIVNQEQSGNSTEFYKDNISFDPSTDAMPYEDVLALKLDMDREPKFPPVYKIYSAEHDTEENEIVFDNISYAIDTPKKDEMIVLTNLTECATPLVASEAKTVLGMSAGNPGKQQVYNPGGTVTICAYDERLKAVVAEAHNLKVTDVSVADGSLDSSVLSIDGSITTSSIRDTSIYKYVDEAAREDSQISFYVIDTTEIDITGKCYDIINSSIYDSSTGEYVKVAFIPVDDSDWDNFREDTMVKICVSLTDDNVGTEPLMVNQSAYRILSLDASYMGLDVSTVGNGYVIRGNVNLCTVNELRQRNFFDKGDTTDPSVNCYYMPELKVTMSTLHSSAVEYGLRVTKDADETLYIYQDYRFYGQKTTVQYDDGQLMFGAYMDDQYAAVPMKYDPLDLYNIWFDADMLDVSAAWFKYTDFPVTVTPGRKVVLKNSDDVSQFMSGWKTSWKWSNYVIEDLSNIRNEETDETLKSKLIFESDNKVLSVMPELLGTQKAELVLTDLYGNVIRNDRGGNLYVKSVDDDLNQNIIKTQL